MGWYSGDHHIHAAGCAHYERPTEGVYPQDMMRHVVGEDLKIGSVLTWGPGWYFQKTFFEGKDNAVSTPENRIRYDVEVSGHPSSHTGHLLLLRLEGAGLSGNQTHRGLAELGLADPAVGEAAGRGHRLHAFRLGAGTEGREAAQL